MHKDILAITNPNYLHGCHPLDLRDYFNDSPFSLICQAGQNALTIDRSDIGSQVFLNMLAVVAGFYILYSPLNYMRIVIAGIFGFIATHSFANGLVYWVVGLFAVTFSDEEFSVKLKLTFICFMLLSILVHLSQDFMQKEL